MPNVHFCCISRVFSRLSILQEPDLPLRPKRLLLKPRSPPQPTVPKAPQLTKQKTLRQRKATRMPKLPMLPRALLLLIIVTMLRTLRLAPMLTRVQLKRPARTTRRPQPITLLPAKLHRPKPPRQTQLQLKSRQLPRSLLAKLLPLPILRLHLSRHPSLP